jgi:hypothetical protein
LSQRARRPRSHAGPGRLGAPVLGVCVAAVLSAAVGCAAAVAYTAETPPWVACTLESGAKQQLLESTITPADAAAVKQGTPLVLTARSDVPVTFAVASTPALLSAPDLDTGPGTASAQPGYELPTYTFTSTNATQAPRVLYWQVSFSTSSLPVCASVSPTIEYTAARRVTVLAAPSIVPEAPFQLSLDHTALFQVRRHAVTYRVSCTSSCTGTMSASAVILRHHRRLRRVSRLDFGPLPLDIAAAGGGSVELEHHYGHGATQLIEAAAHNAEQVELEIDVEATNAKGQPASSQTTTILRR